MTTLADLVILGANRPGEADDLEEAWLMLLDLVEAETVTATEAAARIAATSDVTSNAVRGLIAAAMRAGVFRIHDYVLHTPPEPPA